MPAAAAGEPACTAFTSIIVIVMPVERAACGSSSIESVSAAPPAAFGRRLTDSVAGLSDRCKRSATNSA